MRKSLERIRAGPDVVQLSLLAQEEAKVASTSREAKAEHQLISDEDIAPQLRFDLPIESSEEKYVWTEKDVATLREAVLHDALRTVLDERNSDALRKEMWEWIFSDEALPFSFNVCAKTAGVDPYELRIAFERMAVKLGKAAVEAA